MPMRKTSRTRRISRRYWPCNVPQLRKWFPENEEGGRHRGVDGGDRPLQFLCGLLAGTLYGERLSFALSKQHYLHYFY